MKKLKLLIILVFVTLTGYGQLAVNAPFKAAYPSTTQTAKLNFTNPASSVATYNNVFTDASTTALNNTTGSSTGWSFVINNVFTGGGGFNGTGAVVGDSDFSDAALNGVWFRPTDDSGPIIWSFIGLNPAKTYTIKVGQTESDGFVCDMTWSSTTVTGIDLSTPFTKTTFTSISPDGSGVIAGSLTNNASGNGNVSFNAILITENP